MHIPFQMLTGSLEKLCQTTAVDSQKFLYGKEETMLKNKFQVVGRVIDTKNRLIIFLLIASLLILVAAPRAFADGTNVSVNVNGYAGRWSVDETTSFTGDQVITLEAGTYNFRLLKVDSNYFQFTVDDSGNVTVFDPARATGGANSLTLITHAIDVSVSGYVGGWKSGADQISASDYLGDQTIRLAATTYTFGLKRVEGNFFQYTVDTSGNVAVSDDHKAVAGANSLTLITRAIDFDLGGAPGTWHFGDKTPALSGNQTLCLAPTTYTFGMTGNNFDYTVANSAAPYLFTVSPTSASITVDGINYTVMLSLGSTDSGCFDLPQSAWDDLNRAIAEAQIDVEGIRQSLQAKANAAREAYDRGEPDTAGNILCALLHEVDAQEGVHITPASADDIRNTTVNVATALGIPLPCLDS